MKIERIESWATDQIGFVRITDSDGGEGWGQLSPFGALVSAQYLHDIQAKLVLGRIADDVDDISAHCVRQQYKFHGTFMMRSLSGIDSALWDLKGKRAGKPVCELLGGKPDPIPVYASSMDRRSPIEEVVAAFRKCQEENGARAFKFKIMNFVGRDVDTAPGRAEAFIRAMGEAFPGATLIADANGGYSPDKAIEASRLMADCGIDYLEEPCPCWEIEETARVNSEGAVPVVGGEQDYDDLHWETLFAKKAVVLAQPDLCYMGGLSRTLPLARQAHEHGIGIMPHASNPSLVTLFAMHLMAVIPNPGPYLEFGFGRHQRLREMYEPFLEMKDGHVAFPPGPGWGITINPDWLVKAQYRESRP